MIPYCKLGHKCFHRNNLLLQSGHIPHTYALYIYTHNYVSSINYDSALGAILKIDINHHSNFKMVLISIIYQLNDEDVSVRCSGNKIGSLHKLKIFFDLS